MPGNLLARSTSPYLLQHQANPVHWQPWGEDALAEARARDCPILLSVGYAACHWCHVMAHESFENVEIARLMNDHFVCVKVDREERPDIDAIYMAALHMLGEQGGWPMTMFLTPDGAPFWGGTYFPPEPRWGRPSFPAVLREIARIYADDRPVVENNVSALGRRLAGLSEPAPGEPLGLADADRAAGALMGVMDMVHGGLGGAPKFPNCGVFSLILRAGLRCRETRSVEAVVFALERICEGGIYDHLGGGFARYAVDARWLVPHFEKMLYDNAQLIELLTAAWQATRRPLFAARIAETIAWAEREMRLDGGGFASSLDADSEGEEGRFYVWSAGEIEALLGPEDSRAFAAAYDVAPTGNWEGRTILNRLTAEPYSDSGDARMAPLRAALLAARDARVRPGRDDKILADWNGLMISALARAGAVFARPDWLALAREAFRFVAESMADGECLFHAARAGRRSVHGLAGDYANMASAAVTLYEVAAERAFLDRALAWTTVLDHGFASESGGYFMSPSGAGDLIVRPLSASDEATPAANAVIAENRLRLHLLTGDEAHAAAAARILTAFAGHARANAFSHARLLAAAETAAWPLQIVITGTAASADDLWSAAWRAAAPCAVRFRAPAAGDLPPGLERPEAPPRGASAIVCARQTCSLPLTDPADLAREIETRRGV